ncbi:MAG: hypothetical protein IJ393_06070 [Clostridia bacterium]|nr:hypothetical protein [Clostridia bacterium]MBQ7831616.1 hypothetical protein [Clostridia bacterium]
MFFRIKDYEGLDYALEALSGFLEERSVAPERIFDSKLVACELVGNVLKHAESVAELHGEIKEGFIELKILSDKAFVLPQEIFCSDVYSEHGRGLFLVKQLCKERVFSEQGGIRVLIELL